MAELVEVKLEINRIVRSASTLAAFLLIGSSVEANVYDNLRLVIIPQLEVAPSESSRLFGQQFRMDENDRVEGVTVRLARVGEPSGAVSLELWDDSGSGFPAGKLDELGSVEDLSLMSTDFVDVAFDDSIGNLSPFEEYWVVLNFADASLAIGNTIVWAGFSASAGTNDADRAVVSVDSGSSWVNSPVAYFAMAVHVSLTGDFNGNGTLDSEDIERLTGHSGNQLNDPIYDLNEDSIVDSDDIGVWIKDLFNSWFGDANLDGQFNSADLVSVFQAGEYEDELVTNSSWATGDWNGDAEFDTSDLVFAFQDGGYEQATREAAHVVPEPTSVVLLMGGLVGTAMLRRLAFVLDGERRSATR